MNTLRRYKKHFKVTSRPGLNKALLADSLTRLEEYKYFSCVLYHCSYYLKKNSPVCDGHNVTCAMVQNYVCINIK